MGSYRDDRDALLARVDALERALAEAREGASREDILRQLGDLTAQVAETTADIDEDRRALADVTRSLERMRAGLQPAEPVASARPAPRRKARSAGGAVGVEPTGAPGTRGRAWMFVAGAGAVVAFVLVMLSISAPDKRPEGAVPASTPGALTVPGFPHAVDPSAAFSVARAEVPHDAYLDKIVVRHLSPAGTVDLQAPAYQGSIEYEFARIASESDPTKGAPTGAREPPVRFYDLLTVRIDHGGIKTSRVTTMPFGGEPVPPPRCPARKVWEAALAAGAPADAVATVTYAMSGPSYGIPGGATAPAPEWSLEIPGTSFTARIADDCIERAP